jgi:hypothetical protein
VGQGGSCMHDCFTGLESLCNRVEGVFGPQARLDLFEQARYWAGVTACAGHLMAVVGEEGSNRPPDLTGGSGKQYSHFSIP